MEPQNGGLEDDFPLHFLVILRFQPFIFRDVLKIRRCFGGLWEIAAKGKSTKLFHQMLVYLSPYQVGPEPSYKMLQVGFWGHL